MNTNIKIVLFVLAAVGFFVLFASSIPQIESRPPEEITLGANLGPEELAKVGQQIVTGDRIGCLNCHGIGQTGPRAPDLAGVGARAATREAGLNAEQYLRQALLQPCDYVVEGYDCLMGGLALDKNLTPAEVTAVVAYLESLGGTITVSLSSAELEATPAAPPPAGGGAGLAGTTPAEIVASAGCGGCHTLAALGLAGKVGPDLSGVGARRSPDEIRQSIIDPGAVIADGCPSGPCPNGVMPTNFGDRLTAAQLETLVQFLSSQGGAGTASSAPTPAEAQPTPEAQPTLAPTQVAAAPTEPAAPAPTQPQPTAVAALPAASSAAAVQTVPAAPAPPSPLLLVAAVVGLPVLTIGLGAGLAYAALVFSRMRAGVRK